MRRVSLHGKHGLGKYALVDNEDYDWISQYRWHLNSDGGASTCLFLGLDVRTGRRRNVQLRMHRLVAHPLSRTGLHVDHINHDRLDNRRANLRPCTQQQNNRNLPLSARNKSGFKGVSWHAGAKLWRATIKARHKQVHLGYYKNARDAALAYNRAAREYYGEFASLNQVA